MWERTLQDLVRGLRANKKDEAKFISSAVDEIRREIRSDDMELKAGAVLKLTYLDMMGYDMTWASFHVVEVMSSPRIHLKSVGYLAATQSFGPETDVLMLTTNLLKKDLTSAHPTDAAVSLNGLSHIATAELARDLSRDMFAMLNHSRAHIRKRAVVAMFKIFSKYPDAIPTGMPRVREKLEDSDPGVVAATINMLCELARRNPHEYLPLAPQLFHLLTTSSNNWMLIKIIKLFGSLCPHEPRLVKKLQTPITDIISTTPAISLLYECVHTCIIGGMLNGRVGDALAKTCVTKLAAFLQDPDHNLKYIALLALVKIVPSHPHLVAEHQDVIMASVNDEDMSIRLRALDLISAMVDQQNLQSIVQQLLSHLVQSEAQTAAQSLQQTVSGQTSTSTPPTQSPAYRLLLSQRIISICSQDTYSNVTDFEWYLSVLVDLAYVARVNVGAAIKAQMVDVVARVRQARPYAVTLAVKLLSDDALMAGPDDENSCIEVLWAAAWIVGEYCSELSDPQKLLPFLLDPAVANLPADIITAYLQSVTKVFSQWAIEQADNWDDSYLANLKQQVENIISGLVLFAKNSDVEVQERASNAHQLFNFIRADLSAHRPSAVPLPPKGFSDGPSSGFEDASSSEVPNFPKSLFLLQPLFSGYELGPVALHAQASVPIPDGLDLDAWIVPPPPEEREIDTTHDLDDTSAEKKIKKSKKGKEKTKERNGTSTKSKKDRNQGDVLAPAEEPAETPEEVAEREKQKAERLARLRDDPYYIGGGGSKASTPNVEDIPVVRLDDMPPLAAPVPTTSHLPSLRNLPARSAVPHFVVDTVGEMPKGAKSPTPVAAPAATPSRENTPSRNSVPYSSSPFPEYVVDDEEKRASTPEPIKVTRVKKKGAGKKKRAAGASAETG